MFKYLNKKRQKGPGLAGAMGRGGQSTLEYAILIIIIIGALLSIQVYIKRGVQGRLKSATDDIGTQFSPGNTNVIRTMRTSSVTAETFVSGVSRSDLEDNEITTTVMNAQIVNVLQEYWGSQEDIDG